MKTIEEVAVSKYLSDQKLPERKRMYPEAFIDWANFGAREAQRWILTAEELPKHRDIVLGKVPLKNYPILFAYKEIERKWYQFDKGDFYETKVIPYEWRPIERK
jgi:hypothetical protein